MSYYKVRVYRDTTYTQSYYVNVNTDCPEHAEEMAAEILEDWLKGEDHELACGDPELASDKQLVDVVYEADSGDIEKCENTEDCYLGDYRR